MAFELNENTYITLDDADSIISDILLSADSQRVAWEGISNDADKEGCLKQAAAEIEALKFVGIKLDDNQKMSFPRKYIMHEDSEVPENVKRAQALEALELAAPSSDSQMAEAYAGNVRSYSLGSISENLKSADTYGLKSVIKSVKAQRLLMPYLGGGYRVR